MDERLTREEVMTYRRSVSLLLSIACEELEPRARLQVGQSFGEGYFFEWVCDEPLRPEQVTALEERMNRLVEEDRPFESALLNLREALGLFTAEGATEQLRLLRTLRASAVRVVSIGARHRVLQGPIAASAGGLGGFRLDPYEDGLLLRFPDATRRMREISQLPHLFKVYRDTRRWNEILGVGDVGQLNTVCLGDAIDEVMQVAEALHEKRVGEIADQIRARPSSRLVLIAGPSSSGKTTFSKRLSIQLRVNGIRPQAISLDDYYVDREHTPRDASGALDFEALEAIDLPLLNDHLERLLRGERVETPRFDFTEGRRVPRSQFVPRQLAPEDLLVIEGIHGLNDRLTPAIPLAQKFRIFVSALTQLTIDENERVFTSDSRLLRRIVRDRRFRGYSAERSLALWSSVRRGEECHIFPYQEQADAIFNSTLVYEPAVLKSFAERFLMEVPIDSPEFPEAERLLRFLGLFVPVLPERVPHNSLLREFIGGSSFAY